MASNAEKSGQKSWSLSYERPQFLHFYSGGLVVVIGRCASLDVGVAPSRGAGHGRRQGARANPTPTRHESRVSTTYADTKGWG